MEDDALGWPEAPVASRDDQMNVARDDVGKAKQFESALMRDDGAPRSKSEPLGSNCVVGRRWVGAEPVETPPHALKTSSADMVRKELGTEAEVGRLSRGEVAVLAVRQAL